MKYATFNRSFRVTNNDNWFQILPMGEFPGTLIENGKAGRTITQVVDDVGMGKILAALNALKNEKAWPGLLVEPGVPLCGCAVPAPMVCAYPVPARGGCRV